MNKIFLIGNLAQDPEKSALKDGTPVCFFTLAVPTMRTDRAPQYYNISVIGKLADSCVTYLTKGKKAAVVGTLYAEEYRKRDGTQGFSLKVSASEVEFLTPKEKSNTAIGDISPEDIPS